MSQIELSVLVEDNYLLKTKFADVVKRAKKAGLKVSQQLPDTGLLTGHIDDDKLERLRKVRGVAAVEVSRSVQLPPPTSDVQ